MLQLQQAQRTGGSRTVDKPLPQVLAQVSGALQAAGFGLLTIIEGPATALVGNLTCEISCLAAPPDGATAQGAAQAQVLPCTIRLQAQGEETLLITTIHCAVAERHPDKGEASDAEAACAGVQHAVAQWVEDHSIIASEKENRYPL